VLVVDLFQTLINKVKEMGLLRLPIIMGYNYDFLIIQYVDGTLMIMEACPQQLFVLKYILNTFADSTGLKVNYSKSSVIPINLSPDRLAHLVGTFNCQAGSLPSTYLGLPMSDSKPTI
jgi:serine protease inhibitor ecotin